MKEKSSREISLGDISGDMLEQLIEYCYTGSVQLNTENVESILIHAHRYSIVSLEEACTKFLAQNLNEENCCSMLAVADAFMIVDLKSIVSDYVCEHFMSVVQTDTFNKLASDTLLEILKRNEIVANSEADIFGAIVKWIEYDESNRTADFERLMSAVRFSRIESSVSDCPVASSEHATCFTRA